jgi:hypothetical protein
VCEGAAARCVIIQIGARKLLKDLCDPHLDEVMAGARPIGGKDPANHGAITAGMASVVPISKFRG